MAAVVALIFFLPPGDPPSDPNPPRHPTIADNGTNPPPADRDTPKTVIPPLVNPNPPAVAPEPKKLVYDYKGDLKELRDLLEKPENKDPDRIEINLSADLAWNLGTEPDREPGLVLQARQKVVIKRADKQTRPAIRLTYPADQKPHQNPWVALTINSPETEIEGVRFEIDGTGGNDAPMIGLLLRNGKKHLIKDCEFLQAFPNHKSNPTNIPPATGFHPDRCCPGRPG